MKKIAFLGVVLACLLTLIGCGTVEPVCEFTAHSVRTGYAEKNVGDVSFLNERPSADAIRSIVELSAYTDKYAACFDLSHAESGGKSFLGVTAAYGEQFFEQKNLVIVCIENSSGSIRNEVTKIVRGIPLRIYIQEKAPDICTDDMADWFILIELNKAIDISEIELVLQK